MASPNIPGMLRLCHTSRPPRPAANTGSLAHRFRGGAEKPILRLKAIPADDDGDPGAICRHGEVGSHCICGYFVEPARGLFHVRRGHGCVGTWQTYEV